MTRDELRALAGLETGTRAAGPRHFTTHVPVQPSVIKEAVAPVHIWLWVGPNADFNSARAYSSEKQLVDALFNEMENTGDGSTEQKAKLSFLKNDIHTLKQFVEQIHGIEQFAGDRVYVYALNSDEAAQVSKIGMRG
jgi:hypothetical protein